MKKLSLIFVLCAFMFTACEPTADEAPKGKLTLTSSSVMEFDAAGGAGEITYAFVEEDTRANKINVIAVVDWITDLQLTDNNSVTFNVAANTGDERNATIKVEYGDDSFNVMVMQAADASRVDVTFNATHVGGTFYGKFIEGGKQTEGFNYFVILSDCQPESIWSIPQYATEYRFDIYAAESAEFNSELRIPVGVYTLDHSSSGRVGTIDAFQDNSYLYNGLATPFQSGTLTVTETSIVADVVLQGGETHRVIYNGEPVMEDYSMDTYADVYPVSQYTDTLSFDVTGGYMYAYYRGDWFGTGNDVWFMHMIETKSGFSGVYLIFNFIIPQSGGFDNQEAFYGTYTLSDPSKSLDWTFPAGRLRDDSQQLNAYYMECVSGQIDMSKAAPIKDGTIKVEKVDGDTVITIDGKDDAGNDIKGTFRGTIYEWDNQGVVNK